MSLMPYDPFQLFKLLQRQMDSFHTPYSSLLSEETGAFSILLRETEKEVVAICHAPGLKRMEEMEIEVKGQLLTVARNMKSTEELKGKNIYKSRRYSGYFCKSLSLPCPVKGWYTTLEDGALKIHMSKSPAIG